MAAPMTEETKKRRLEAPKDNVAIRLTMLANPLLVRESAPQQVHKAVFTIDKELSDVAVKLARLVKAVPNHDAGQLCAALQTLLKAQVELHTAVVGPNIHLTEEELALFK